jgi:hypothetical protein
MIEQVSQKQVEVLQLLKTKLLRSDLMEFPDITMEKVQTQDGLLQSCQASNLKVREIIQNEVESNTIIKQQMKQMDEIALKRHSEIDQIEQDIADLNHKLSKFIREKDIDPRGFVNLTSFEHKQAENLIADKSKSQQDDLK